MDNKSSSFNPLCLLLVVAGVAALIATGVVVAVFCCRSPKQGRKRGEDRPYAFQYVPVGSVPVRGGGGPPLAPNVVEASSSGEDEV